MNDAARRIQRIYLTLTARATPSRPRSSGGSTRSSCSTPDSRNLEAFAANAFFTAGMVLFEVPTGVVADAWGRRVSYLLGTLTLAGSTFLYYLLWVIERAVLAVGGRLDAARARASPSSPGAVEAWLVDALHYAGYEGGARDGARARARWSAGAAMLGGSVAGGVIAQATNLGVPFLMRVGVLLVMFVVAVAADARPRLHAGAARRSPLQATRRRSSTPRSSTA